jgi:uncharacterized protein
MKTLRHRSLILLGDHLAVCRRAPGESIPAWATTGELCSVTRSGKEISIICSEASVPETELAERGWRALRFADTLDFAEVGILAALSAPLAKAGISIFVVSTFDTDYVFVKHEHLREALKTLRTVGYRISR